LVYCALISDTLTASHGYGSFKIVHSWGRKMNRFKVSENRLPLVACMVFSALTLPINSVVAQTTASAGGSGASYTAPGYGQYPRVTEFEQQLLGKTYEKDPLAARVARLETKQFGKTSPNDDLADRLDKLDQFVKPKPEPQDDSAAYEAAQSGGGGNQASGGAGSAGGSGGATAVGGAAGATSTASAGGPSGHVSTDSQYSESDYGNYPRVTELEQQFLGSTFVKDPLPVRIARLETKKFGKTSPDDELCDRIDRLDKLAPKQNSRVANNDQDDSNSNNSNNNNSKSSKAGGIGRALLGMLGNSLGGGMGGGGLGGIGGGGMGMGGLASGLMGNNMGAMMPGLQDDMRKDAAEKNGRQSGGSGGSSRAASRAPVANSSPFAADAPQIYGMENKVAAIEKFVLGKEHSELPIEERVTHVEKKLVPYEHNQAGKDIGVRVDHLWSILAAANKSTKSVATAGSTE
jgi:hypothetical protein